MNYLSVVTLLVLLLAGVCSGFKSANPYFRKHMRTRNDPGRGMGFEQIGKMMARDQLKEDKKTANCWLRPIGSKKSPRSLFQISCSEDGINFYEKQCSEDRCWCLDVDGYRVEDGGRDDDGYYYGVADGLSLRCPKSSP